MKDILLPKEEALRIAISILSGKATNKDFGSSALKESELILKNILETLEIEKEMMTQSEPLKPKPKRKPKKPNKKVSEAEMAYFSQVLDGMEESDKQGKTILDLEKTP